MSCMHQACVYQPNVLDARLRVDVCTEKRELHSNVKLVDVTEGVDTE